MKLKWHNAETTPPYNKTIGSTIYVSLKFGKILFNGASIDLLKLKHKEGVSFAQDEENPTDWYLKKDSKGFTVTVRTTKGTISAYITNKKFTIDFMRSIGKPDNEYIKFKIVPEEKDGVYTILTSKAIKEK